MDTGALGEGRVSILQTDGKSVPGFGLEDCDLLNGDHFDKVVSWKGREDVSSLAGQVVRLRLAMCGTKLYAFQFVALEAEQAAAMPVRQGIAPRNVDIAKLPAAFPAGSVEIPVPSATSKIPT